jgi:hypothetical protein
MTSNKEKYVAWVKDKPLSIFAQPWWLDAVAGDEWDVILVEKNQEIIASLPFLKRLTAGLKTMVLLPLSPHNGFFMLYPDNQKQTSKLAYEKEVLTELCTQIAAEKPAAFYQQFPYTFTNWLPFYWQNYAQTTRYTYVLSELTEVQNLIQEFDSSVRGHIKKAQKTVIVTTEVDLDEFYRLYQMTFSRQGLETQITLPFLQRLDAACVAHNCRKMFLARDAAGQAHAAIYLIWDQHAVYYLLTGSDPSLRSSGAMSLLIWEAIQFAATVAPCFDFEGSMIEPIERFFRSFGAEQKPYFVIEKTFSQPLKIVKSLRALLH